MGPLATFLGGPWLDDGIPSWPHESLLPPPDRFLSRCYAYLPRGILASTLYFTLARSSRINSSNLNTAFLSSLFQIFGILESTPTRTRSRFLSLSLFSLFLWKNTSRDEQLERKDRSFATPLSRRRRWRINCLGRGR